MFRKRRNLVPCKWFSEEISNHISSVHATLKARFSMLLSVTKKYGCQHGELVLMALRLGTTVCVVSNVDLALPETAVSTKPSLTTH